MIFNMVGIGSGSSGALKYYSYNAMEVASTNTSTSQWQIALTIPKAGKYFLSFEYAGNVKQSSGSTTFNQQVSGYLFNTPVITTVNATYEYANPSLDSGNYKSAAFIINASADNATFKMKFKTPFAAFSSRYAQLYVYYQYWYDQSDDVEISAVLSLV